VYGASSRFLGGGAIGGGLTSAFGGIAPLAHTPRTGYNDNVIARQYIRNGDEALLAGILLHSPLGGGGVNTP